MAIDINNILSNTLIGWLDFFNNTIPVEYRPYLNLGIFIVLITLYSIFVWNFSRFIGKRDLLELNLSQYNKYNHPLATKLFAALLFILEYIIILPIVVFFWFVVVALILLVLAKEHNIENILLISAVIIGAIRISAYYKEDLSKDLAKLFPFTILAVALLTPGFFDLKDTLSKLASIPDLFSNILFYLLMIAILEFILRIVYLIMPPIEEEEESFSSKD